MIEIGDKPLLKRMSCPKSRCRDILRFGEISLPCSVMTLRNLLPETVHPLRSYEAYTHRSFRSSVVRIFPRRFRRRLSFMASGNTFAKNMSKFYLSGILRENLHSFL